MTGEFFKGLKTGKYREAKNMYYKIDEICCSCKYCDTCNHEQCVTPRYEMVVILKMLSEEMEKLKNEI